MSDVDDGVAALRELIRAGEAFRNSAAAALGIGMRETEALSHLRSMGPIRQHDLGAELKLTPGSITNLVDRLEAQGLATREPAPNDRRASLVTLTPRALAAMHESGLRLEQCVREAAGANPAELARILSSLARTLRANCPPPLVNESQRRSGRLPCGAPA